MSESSSDFWKSEEVICSQRLAESADFDIPDHYFQRNIGWLELIKTLRALTGASLTEAQTRAVAHPGWRRWLQRRVNEDPRCAKEARLYLRDVGSSPFLTMVDGHPRFTANDQS